MADLDTDFNVDPYYDDFDEDKNFHRVLFRPGKAVQARELTQLQTILQEQFNRFGRHVFENGSPLIDGGVSLDNKVNYIKLQPTLGANTIVPSTLEGKKIFGATSGANGVCILSTAAGGSDPPTLYVRLLSDTNFSTNEYIREFGTLTNLANTATTTPTGNSFVVGVEAGVYFIDGFFVRNTKQHIVVGKYTDRPTKKVGWTVTEETINSGDDSTILDPAQGAYNYAAPGSDRFKITLTLASKDIGDADTKFINLMTVKDGYVQDIVKHSEYSELGKTMARRTYDESGSYTVTHPVVHFKDHIGGNTELLSMAVEPCKCFIYGTEIESYATTYMDVLKARTTQAYNNIDTFAQYGNYCLLTGVEGPFDITAMEEVDLHNAPAHRRITFSSSTSSPQAGNFTLSEFVTGNTSGANAQVMYWSSSDNVLSVNAQSATAFANGETITGLTSGANGTVIFDQAPIDSSSSSNYANTKIGTARIRQLTYESGSAAGPYIYRGYLFNASYTGGNEFAAVNGLFVGPYNNTLAGKADIETVTGQNSDNNSLLFDSNYNHLVYPLPQATIKTIRDASGNVDTNYRFRRVFKDVAFTSGTATITTADASEAFYGSGALSNSNKATYYHVIAEEEAGSINKGDVLYMDTGGRAITVSPSTQATFNLSNASLSLECTIIATIEDNVAQEKSKTLNINQVHVITNPNTSATATETIPASDIYKLKGIYTGANTTFTPVPPVLTLGTVTGTFTQGEIITGSTSNANGDVILWTSGNSTLEYVTNYGTFANSEVVLGATSGANGTITSLDVGNTNVNNNYTWSSGQNDSFYDHGSITLKYGATPPTGQIKVVYDNFSHTGTGYCSVDSYSIPYGDIPSYVSPTTSQEVELRDCLDFRPRRADGNTTFENIQIPDDSTNVQADFDAYLLRSDLLSLDTAGVLGLTRGIPSPSPKTPNVSEERLMVLYHIAVPAYTFNAKDIKVRFVGNPRYTMKMIGDIVRRVERLEYYTTLSLLEDSAKNMIVQDSAGLDRFKNGILVDQFTGHNIGDVRNMDYRIAVDSENQELVAPFLTRNYALSYANTESTGIQLTGDILTLPYSTETFITQPLCSTYVNVNPFDVIKWFGVMKLDPPSDEWIDITRKPDVLVNFAGNNDAWEFLGQTVNGLMASGFGANWNEWETINVGSRVKSSSVRMVNRWMSTPVMGNQFKGYWLAQPVGRTTTYENYLEQERQGEGFSFTPETITRSLGDRVVDVGIVPFIRARDVTITTHGMRPNTRVYAFFDRVDINAQCTPAGGSLGGELRTNSVGSITLTFAIPATDILNFRTGERLFRLIDSSSDDIGVCTTMAEQTYAAQGLIKTVENTSMSVRTWGGVKTEMFDERRTTEGQETYSTYRKLPLYATHGDTGGFLPRGISTGSWSSQTGPGGDYGTKNYCRLDPLAQTFIVDGNLYEEGVYISSLTVYLKSKSDTMPLICQIRTTENGYPSANKILPFSTVIVQAANVNVSDDATASTEFVFDAPVYLSPNEEYAFVLLAQSIDYEAWISEMGKFKLGTTERIAQQPYIGSLFKSQNSSTWTPEQTQDMMFLLKKCVFTTGGTHEAILNTPAATSNTNMDLIRPVIQDLTPYSSGIHYSQKATKVSTGSLDTSWVSTIGNDNIFFDEQHHIKNSNGSYKTRAQLVSLNSDISPVIDTKRMSVITVENLINNSTAGEANTVGGAASARYISRTVKLKPGFDATDLQVTLDGYKESTADISVYYKVLSADDSELMADKTWVKMYEKDSAGNVASARDNFLEITYTSSSANFPSITYTTSGGATYTSFQTYAIKIVLTSSNTAKPPKVRGLRVIAFA